MSQREKLRDKAISQLNFVGNTGWWVSTATIFKALVLKGIEGLPESPEDFSDCFLHYMAYYRLQNRYVHAVDDNGFSFMWIFVSNHARKNLDIDRETLQDAQQSMWALFRRTWLVNSGSYQQSLVPSSKPAPPTTAPPTSPLVTVPLATGPLATVPLATVPLATVIVPLASVSSTATVPVTVISDISLDSAETAINVVVPGTVLGETSSLADSERRGRSFQRLACVYLFSYSHCLSGLLAFEIVPCCTTEGCHTRGR